MNNKLLSLLVSSLFFTNVSANDDDIQISKDLNDLSELKTESQTDFHASLQDDKTVIVESSESTDFSVEITDNNSGTVVYDGSTYNGSQHETDTLPEGDYTIKITTSEGSYSGEFNIE